MHRRLLSILLFWATLFPSFASALTSGAMGQSTLPACCRHGAQHHCDMSPEVRALLLNESNGSHAHQRQARAVPLPPALSRPASHLQTLTRRRRPNASRFLSPRALTRRSGRVPPSHLLRSLPPEARPSLSPQLALPAPCDSGCRSAVSLRRAPHPYQDL